MTASRILSMWSGPRNVSTAMMYSWRQRSDTKVFDEPFYGIYLSNTNLEHPVRCEIIRAQPTDPEAVFAELGAGSGSPLRFVKNMAHHLDALPIELLDRFENVLLIRDPRDMVPSLAKTLGLSLQVRQTGLPQQVEILRHLQETMASPIVLDAKRFLADPAAGLKTLCSALDVPWRTEMLSWPQGPKPEDGIWAPHWYHNVHASTRFGSYRTQTEPHPKELTGVIDACIPHYETLLEQAL